MPNKYICIFTGMDQGSFSNGTPTSTPASSAVTTSVITRSQESSSPRPNSGKFCYFYAYIIINSQNLGCINLLMRD